MPRHLPIRSQWLDRRNSVPRPNGLSSSGDSGVPSGRVIRYCDEPWVSTMAARTRAPMNIYARRCTGARSGSFRKVAFPVGPNARAIPREPSRPPIWAFHERVGEAAGFKQAIAFAKWRVEHFAQTWLLEAARLLGARATIERWMWWFVRERGTCPAPDLGLRSPSGTPSR